MMKKIGDFFRFLKDLDRRIKATIIGTGIMDWGRNLTSRYDTLYANGLGADASDIGMLSSLASAVGAIVSIPMGWAVEKFGVKKVMLLSLVLFTLHAMIFALSGNWLMLIPAYIISARMARMNPLSDIVFITYTDPQKRATLMSLSRVFWAFLGIFAPLAAAFVVAAFGGINVEGIRPLYIIQTFSTIFVFALMFWKLPPIPGSSQKKGDSESNWTSLAHGYQEVLLDKYAGRFIMLNTVRRFASAISMPFVPLWMVDVKGADPYILGIMGAIGSIVSLTLQVPAGKLADMIGRKKVYYLFQPLCFLGTIVLILAPSPEYLLLAGFLGVLGIGGGVTGGGIGTIANTPFHTMFWEIVPEGKRGRLFGIEGVLGLATIPAYILGGVLWEQGFMIGVLVTPILLIGLVVIPILSTIPDTLTRSKR